MPFNIFFIKKSTNKIYKTIYIFITISQIFIIILLQSRTVWLTTFIYLLFASLYKFKQNNYNIKKLLRYLISSSLVFLPFIIWGLYEIRPESIIGRIFIWKICFYIIWDNFFLGFGTGKFGYIHNKYQIEFFKKNHLQYFEENSFHVDDLNFAFNDFLQYCVEFGFIGVILIIPIFIIFFNKSIKLITKGNEFVMACFSAVCIILLTSISSYPLQRIQFLIIIAFCFGVVFYDKRSHSSIYYNKYFYLKKILLKIIGFSLSSLLIYYIYGLYNWNNAYRYYMNSEFSKVDSSYKNAYRVLNHSSEFLYNYGVVLHHQARLNQSLEILIICSKNKYDNELLCYCGDIYEKLGDYQKAEFSFRQAYYLIPYLLYPKYRLALIYYNLNRESEACKISNEIIRRKAKITSSSANRIKSHILQFQKDYSCP